MFCLPYLHASVDWTAVEVVEFGRIGEHQGGRFPPPLMPLSHLWLSSQDMPGVLSCAQQLLSSMILVWRASL